MRKLLSDPKRFTGRSMGRKHLLSGIAYCGECGRRMGTTVRRLKSGGNRPVYQCKNVGCMRMVRDLAKTDELVIGVITERLADPDAARKLSKPTVDTKALHDQIDTLRKLITATREEYTEGLIDARDRNARIERITEKLSPLEDKVLGSHMSRDVKDLPAARCGRAVRAAAGPPSRVVDTLATVTIHRQAKQGGRFDPEAITVDWKSSAPDTVANCDLSENREPADTPDDVTYSGVPVGVEAKAFADPPVNAIAAPPREDEKAPVRRKVLQNALIQGSHTRH